MGGGGVAISVWVQWLQTDESQYPSGKRKTPIACLRQGPCLVPQETQDLCYVWKELKLVLELKKTPDAFRRKKKVTSNPRIRDCVVSASTSGYESCYWLRICQ